MDIKFIMPILRSVPLAVLFVFAICSFSFLHSFSRFLVYVQKKSRLSWMTSCPYRHLIGYGRIKFCCCSCYSCNWNIYISSRLLSAKDFVHYECIFLWNHNNDFICNDSRSMADGSISFFFTREYPNGEFNGMKKSPMCQFVIFGSTVKCRMWVWHS